LVEAAKRHVSRPVRAMIEMQLLTGARPGEIIIMRRGDIDRSRPVWTYRPIEHKTQHHGNDRVILIGPKAQEALAPFLLRPDDCYCFSPLEAEKRRYEILRENRITPDSCGNTPSNVSMDESGRFIGEHYTQDSYRRAIDRGCEKAFPLPEPLARKEGETVERWEQRLGPVGKLKIIAWRKAHHWHPHQLRHNYATYVRKEYGLEAAQVLLGHSKADVTQIYAERDMSRATEVAKKIG
jgi:integrase